MMPIVKPWQRSAKADRRQEPAEGPHHQTAVPRRQSEPLVVTLPKVSPFPQPSPSTPAAAACAAVAGRAGSRSPHPGGRPSRSAPSPGTRRGSSPSDRRSCRQSEPLVVTLPKVSPFPRPSPSRRQRPRVQLSPAVLDPVPLILVDGLPDPHRRQEPAEDPHHQTAVPVARASPWSSRCRR